MASGFLHEGNLVSEILIVDVRLLIPRRRVEHHLVTRLDVGNVLVNNTFHLSTTSRDCNVLNFSFLLIHRMTWLGKDPEGIQ